MVSWRELAADVIGEAQQQRAAVSAERACGAYTKSLPRVLVVGLDLLVRMPPPALKNRDVWAEVVRDAETIAANGWAAHALALGWQPLEIFGCGKGGSGLFESLAVWLGGRKLILLDGASAIATDARRHSVFNRRRDLISNHDSEAVFLWDLGKR